MTRSHRSNRRSLTGGAPRLIALLATVAAVALLLPLAGVAAAAPQEGANSSGQPSQGSLEEARSVCEQVVYDHDDFRCVGGFWARDADGKRADAGIFALDPGLGKLIGENRGRVTLFDYDTASGIPQQTDIISPFPPPDNGFLSAQHYDARDHRLFKALPPEAVTESPPRNCAGQRVVICGTNPYRLAALDLTAPEDADGDGAPGTMFTFPDQARGMGPWGMAYDAVHGVLYVATHQTLLNQTIGLAQANSVANGVVLHAIDVSRLLPGPDDEPGEFTAEPGAAYLWGRRLDGCTRMRGSLHIGVTTDGQAVYLPCMTTGWPGSPPGARHGMMHVDLNLDGRHPRNLNQSDIQQFGLRLTPVASTASSADSTVDAGSDIFLWGVRDANRPRLWVFDGQRAGFTGFLPYINQGMSLGFAPGTGRTYMQDRGSDPSVRIFDTRQIPVPQGRDSTLAPGVIAGDPASNRIYTSTNKAFDGSSDNRSRGNQVAGIVFEDHTGPFPRDEEPDPDAETNDIDPADALAVSHAGSGSGYGARLRWVGGFRASTEHPLRSDGPGAETVACFHEARSEVECGQEGGAVAEEMGLSTDDRDSFFGFVGRNPTQSGFSGDRVSGKAQAEGTGVALGEPWWQDYATHLDEDRQLQDQQEFQTSTCGDRGAGDEDAQNEASAPGSRVTCEPKEAVTAAAWSSELQNGLPGVDVRVGYARSDFTTERDPGVGVTSRTVSVARNVTVGMPDAGALHIGEIRTVARVRAGGRPGTAGSEFTVSINQLRLEGPGGETLFACGWDTAGPSSGEPDDPDGRCDPTAIQAALSRHWPAPVVAQFPRPDRRQFMTGSPGGAQAAIQKAPAAFWNDKLTMGDERWELPGLRLTLYKDGVRESRFVLDLAAVRAEAKYLIGSAPGGAPPPIDDGPTDLQPAGLEIELNDPDGEPLAGGEFAVHGDVVGNGLLDASDPLVDTNAGTCTTGEDGVGDCVFDDLDPGGYVITQTAAPDGYAPAPDFPVTLTDGFTSTVAFTNLRSVADIKITLTDTADPPSPLPGAEFVAVHGDAAADDADGDGGLAPPELSDLRDDGALQQHTFRCTTDADGRCAMADVPLGPYTVRQTSAPDGYQPLGEDITFEFTDPGQVADLGLTNVRAADDGGVQPAGEGSATFDGGATGTGQAGLSSGATAPIRLDAGQAAPEPVVASQPNQQDQGLRRLVKLPAQGLGFLLRSPGEAAPFAAVWLLLGAPIYLLARRRSLNMTTTGQIS